MISTNHLNKEEMLVLYVLIEFELGDTAKVYLYSAMLRAIQENGAAALVA